MRRVEIVCNGLPLWHGAQLPVGTTCVSPVIRSASRGPEPTVSPASFFSKQRGVGVATPTPSYRARRDATSSYLMLKLVAAGVPSLPPSSGSLHERKLHVRMLPFARLCVRPMSLAGAASSLSQLRGPSPAVSLDTVASAAGEPAVHKVLQNERWLHAPASSRLPDRA